jgi:hypothetical protein
VQKNFLHLTVVVSENAFGVKVAEHSNSTATFSNTERGRGRAGQGPDFTGKLRLAAPKHFYSGKRISGRNDIKLFSSKLDCLSLALLFSLVQ